MKVVLFCGGLGMRLRRDGENVPKPLVAIGDRPILWHLMQYYAHFGHTEFILCLGYRRDEVRKYFLLPGNHPPEWTITFADTGERANVGERLMAVRPHLARESRFLANYADGLTDLHLPDLIDFSKAHEAVAVFMSVRPSLSYHLVSADTQGVVHGIHEMSRSELRMNAGFFVFRQEIFDYIRDGEELVHAPFQRLIAEGRLRAYRHDGFFASMDTYKDKHMLEDLYATGRAPWEVWKALGAVT